MKDVIEKNNNLFLFESILYIILGTLAIAIPPLFSLSIEILIGSLFLIGGIFQTFRVLKEGSSSEGFWPALFLSLLFVVIGLLLLAYPITGVIALTMLLAIFFFIQGVAQIALGFHIKSTPGSGWLIFSGIIALILAFIIWSQLPGSAVWVIGLLVGINLLITGFSQLFLWFASRKHG